MKVQRGTCVEKSVLLREARNRSLFLYKLFWLLNMLPNHISPPPHTHTIKFILGTSLLLWGNDPKTTTKATHSRKCFLGLGFQRCKCQSQKGSKGRGNREVIFVQQGHAHSASPNEHHRLGSRVQIHEPRESINIQTIIEAYCKPWLAWDSLCGPQDGLELTEIRLLLPPSVRINGLHPRTWPHHI